MTVTITEPDVFVRSLQAHRSSIATRLLAAADRLKVRRDKVRSVVDGFAAPRSVVLAAFGRACEPVGPGTARGRGGGRSGA